MKWVLTTSNNRVKNVLIFRSGIMVYDVFFKCKSFEEWDISVRGIIWDMIYIIKLVSTGQISRFLNFCTWGVIKHVVLRKYLIKFHL